MNDAAPMPALLLFGATGAIGACISEQFRARGWSVVGVTRRTGAVEGCVKWDPLEYADGEGLVELARRGPFQAACWAQGQNANDSIRDFDRSAHEEMYRGNVLYILESLAQLLKNGVLAVPARLCVISSIWQNLARQNKLSYTVTKAALQGLVLSLANDLGRDGHLVNAVLPGVLDTPMTRKNLAPEQIERVLGATQFNKLPNLEDVASMVHYLCSEQNTGVTGQFIKVDLGFSDVRII